MPGRSFPTAEKDQIAGLAADLVQGIGGDLDVFVAGFAIRRAAAHVHLEMVAIAERADEIAREGDMVADGPGDAGGIVEGAREIRAAAIGAGDHGHAGIVEQLAQRQGPAQVIDDVLAERLQPRQAQPGGDPDGFLDIGAPGNRAGRKAEAHLALGGGQGG